METKYFALLLDLLGIENPDDYLSFPDFVAQQQSKTREIYIFHRYAVIFQGYLDLLSNKITLEQFLSIGDIDSSYFLSTYPQPKEFLHLLENGQLPHAITIIFDKFFFENVLNLSERTKIKDLLKNKNSVLLLYP